MTKSIVRMEIDDAEKARFYKEYFFWLDHSAHLPQSERKELYRKLREHPIWVRSLEMK